MTEHDRLPLHDVRVVDLSDAVGEAGARLLADLGADTIKVEPPGGGPTRGQKPVVHDCSLPFALRNVNKRGTAADLGREEDRRQVAELVGQADIAFLTRETAAQLDVDELVKEHPHLVAVVSSPFGRTGPRAHWQATERTLLALSGSLSRSGRPGDVPLLPPDGLADATAATQAAWTALVAYRVRLHTGRGQVVDLSHHEAVVTGLDPAFGVQGSAAAGRSGSVRRDRPPADSYPVFRCADGYVRLCLLSKRQWRGMFAWLGEPGEFADPVYDSISARAKAADHLEPLIAGLFAHRPAAELVEEAARRGVPLAQVLTLGQTLQSDHFTKAGTVARVEIAPGLEVNVPVGCVDVNGNKLGIRRPSPPLPRHGSGDATWPARETSAPDLRETLPFSGLRVLDLGVIVFGAEVGRAFADLGADVIKVESLAYPDGLRQTRGGEPMNASFAWGQRNKRSLGLDLRSDEGREIFLELAAASDVVLSNFKPGTLESLGIGYETLSARNEGIVVLESAAFHSRGPWARRLGYGPLVRAACGVSSLWKYTDDQTECWDGVTVFPDHVAARVASLAVAAALLRRDRHGHGCRVELGQSDVVLHQLAAYAAHESLVPGAVKAVGNRGRELFGGVFPCAGDDEWCVVEARDAEELDRLRAAVGAPLSVRTDMELERAVAAWTASRSPHEVMERLQSLGLPAAAMHRLPELLTDPQLAHRSSYTTLHHPDLGHDLPTESTGAPFEFLPPAPLRPAPSPGEHTRTVLTDVLGLDVDRVEALFARGVVHDGSAT